MCTSIDARSCTACYWRNCWQGVRNNDHKGFIGTAVNISNSVVNGERSRTIDRNQAGATYTTVCSIIAPYTTGGGTGQLCTAIDAGSCAACYWRNCWQWVGDNDHKGFIGAAVNIGNSIVNGKRSRTIDRNKSGTAYATVGAIVAPYTAGGGTR